jgi:vanillate O-demethylase monooxygenase subunit
VWPGEAALADEALIPHVPTVANGEGRKVLYGRTPVAAHYELGSDNLMDLTHVEFLHGAAFGKTTQRDAIKTVTEEGDHVIMDWWMPNGVPAPGLDVYFEAGDKPVDIWLNVRWQPPAILTLTIGFTAAGAPRSEGRVMLLHNFLTPESDEKYNYFWAVSRNEKLDDPKVDEVLLAANKHAFDLDDGPMIAACHERMKGEEFWSLGPVLLENDGGAVRVRRKLAALVEAEQARMKSPDAAPA